ncbi:hypothetical protein TTHERM_00628620 (macronuclear) [Tetrahymena thermophila SB210]|uniref:Uncharacterized protein n=1 Tax=Tetrahymena thermophila (strain SB210) TaxID=312017 RepID=Q23RT6_TETTS|nr:hypothetical protein TTHERM_00628620 [Tetrahymena thermophila SB210]EAR99303.1 hypothetical protein TTHERM_00628620 [Tetrahymena thermophila SB210]|eukprot:XP_001019548.1 hypothetical protein TTHERM_00628620 [Tetrahymena thermophila SB210]
MAKIIFKILLMFQTDFNCLQNIIFNVSKSVNHPVQFSNIIDTRVTELNQSGITKPNTIEDIL